MQNLPSSGTKYAKLIKSCIKPPKARYVVDKTKWLDVLTPFVNTSEVVK